MYIIKWYMNVYVIGWYMQGSTTGSVHANDRLMKELKDIYRSSSYKDGFHSIFVIQYYFFCDD